MRFPFIIIILAAALTSCGPTLYVPNTINTPLLAKKKDFKAVIGVIGLAPEANVDLQGSYAFHDHFAAMANLSFMNGSSGTKEQTSPDRRNIHNLAESGIGAYLSFWKNKRDVAIGRAEIFGGTGLGWAEDYNHYIEYNERRLNKYLGVYQRYFLQPAFGIRSRIIDLSVATRISEVHFLNYKHIRDGNVVDQSSFGFSTIEPVFTIALGYKHVKYYMQVGAVLPLRKLENLEKVSNYEGSDGHFNFGLVGCPWWEKPKEKPTITLKPAPEEKETQPIQQLPPPVINIEHSKVTICLREGGSPDGDVVSISFNGVFVVTHIELTKEPQCFDVDVRREWENLLQVHAISDGRFKPNTLHLTVKDGRTERTYYLRTEAGKTEEVRFRLN